MPPGSPPRTARRLARLPLGEALDTLGDELVVAGQELRDLPTYSLEARGDGLWVATVTPPGGPPVETELQLDGRRVRDYGCDCPAFGRDAACAHLAAQVAAVLLRRQVRTSRRAQPAPGPQTASVKRLLQAVGDDELRGFVAAYARRHPDFALDLRVRFAESLPVANRFEQVVKNLLRRTGPSYGPSQARRIADALAQFAEQRERYLAEGAWLDLFELNTTLAPRLVVVIDKAARVRVDLRAYAEACLRELAAAARRSPPPDLLERLGRWLDEQRGRGAYVRHGLGGALADLADALADDDGRRASALLDEAERQHGARRELTAERMALLYRHGRGEEARALLLDHLDDAELVADALQAEVAADRLSRALRLAEAAYERQRGPDDRLRLARFLAAGALPAGRPDLLATYVPGVVVADGSPAVLREVLDGEGADAVAVPLAEATLAAVEASSLRPARRDALRADLLLLLGRHAEVEALLYRSTAPAVIAEVAPRLVGRLPDDDLALLLNSKIREHLADRFGRAPAEWVAGLLDDVARRSRTELAAGLVAGLRRDFRQRPALLDALDDALL